MHDFAGIIFAGMFWGVVAAVVLVPVYLRHKDREQMHETLRLAYEKGQPVPPELIEALQSKTPIRPMSTPERDLRMAVILIAVGLGFAGLGYGIWYGLMSVDDTAAYISGGSTAGVGAIPGMIGLGYLVLWFSRRKTAAV